MHHQQFSSPFNGIKMEQLTVVVILISSGPSETSTTSLSVIILDCILLSLLYKDTTTTNPNRMKSSSSIVRYQWTIFCVVACMLAPLVSSQTEDPTSTTVPTHYSDAIVSVRACATN